MKEFLRYITRPSGFGRTEWGAWGTALGIALFGVWCVFNDINTATVIVVGICFALTFLIFLWGTIKNFREDQRDLSNPNNHMSDIYYEGTPLPTRKDGGPILDPVKWYAARYECSREMAQRAMKHESAQKEYRAYLANKKFDRWNT